LVNTALPSSIAFLVDVDDTLLENDRISDHNVLIYVHKEEALATVGRRYGQARHRRGQRVTVASAGDGRTGTGATPGAESRVALPGRELTLT
jgi:hypothetical protein